MEKAYYHYAEKMDILRGSPQRLYDGFIIDAGFGFGLGIAGGSAFHLLKGIYNSPKGQRLAGGSRAVFMNAPRVAGWCALWGSVLSATTCMAIHVRQKEDRWNIILAGASTAGFMYLRRGLVPASRAALCGGLLFSVQQGLDLLMVKVLSTGPLAVAKPITVDSPRNTTGLLPNQFPEEVPYWDQAPPKPSSFKNFDASTINL